MLTSVLIFVFTLAVCLFNALAIPQAPTTLIFDSQQYQWTTAQVGEFLKSVIHLHPDFSTVNNEIFHRMIMLDGPALPVFHAVVLAFIGKVTTVGQWQTLVWIESILHAITAVLIYWIARKLADDLGKPADGSGNRTVEGDAMRRRYLPLACTLLWALYPPAVIASARYLSENLTVVTLLLLVLAFARNWLAVVGFSSAFLILLKPALAPGAAIAVLVMLSRRCMHRPYDYRAIVRTILPLGLAAAAVLAPWLLYTKATTGKIQLTVQRYPAYNLMIGCNSETRSWCTMPHDEFTNLMQDDASGFAPVVSQWTRTPAECFSLISEKINRLYAHPWNDFRKPFLGIDAQAQYVAHWLILLLGFTGAFSMLLYNRRNSIGWIILTLAASQLAYVMFEGVARYAFTTIPLLVLMICFLPVSVDVPVYVEGDAMRRRFIPALAGLALTLLICLPQSTQEHQYIATNIKKTIDLSKTTIADCSALVLVDGDANLEHAKVIVNGHELPETLRPFHYYDPELYTAVFYNDQLAWASNMPKENIRTWRAVPCDWNFLNPTGKNEIEIKLDKPATIYADQNSARKMLATNWVIPDKVCNSAFDLDPRIPAPITTGNIQQVSSVDGTTIPTPLRVKLAIVTDASSSPGSAGVLPGTTSFPNTRINKKTWKSTQSAAFDVPLTNIGNSTHLHIKLEGSVRSLNKPCNVSALVSCKGTGTFTVPLWNNPRSLHATSDWTAFQIDDIYPIGAISPTGIEVLLCPGEWQKTCFYGFSRDNTDAEFRDLKLSVAGLNSVNVHGKRLFFY